LNSNRVNSEQQIGFRIEVSKRRLVIRFLLLCWCGLPVSATSAEVSSTASSPDHRGPGTKRPSISALHLPVKASLDLAHVDPAGFAAALEKDPTRIFEFVRDQIRYEVYSGCLRGPRGTLLAMSGNSVDRAALLASLLRSADQRVRFARGSLSSTDAAALVDSMWAGETAPEQPKEPPPELKSSVELLRQGMTHDYKGIWETLKREKFAIVGHDFVPDRDALVATAKNHFWVQWQKEGQWIDLDPSFGDAVPGKAFTSAETTFENFPESLFHHVTVRVHIEEYSVLSSGSEPATPVKREILSYSSRAADLSAAHLVFGHQPENWKGPVKGVARALAAGMNNTGKLKPVLITGPNKWTAGESFRTKLPEKGSGGGFNSMLSGEGTRKPVALTVAEYIDFEFITPEGKKDNVSREVFDVIRKGGPADSKNVTADLVRDRVAAPDNTDLRCSLFDLFFTNGTIQRVHFDRMTTSEAPKPATILSLLQCLNVTFAVGSDMLGSRMEWPGRSIVRFYPDSPRVQIAELTTAGTKRRLLLDLRRDHLFAAANGSHAGDIFSARILRGVVDGTLERILVEYLTGPAREKKVLEPLVSTSSVFEQAASEKIPSVLFSNKALDFDPGIPPEVVSRLKEELAAGFVAVAPKKPVELAAGRRMAWWRLDPRSGETIAMTDEGLRGASTEREFVLVETSEGNVAAVEVAEETAVSISPPRGGDPPQVFKTMEDALAWIETEGHSVWPSSTGVVPEEPPL
jgi:transglutaminase-like putative cysteine protease